MFRCKLRVTSRQAMDCPKIRNPSMIAENMGDLDTMRNRKSKSKLFLIPIRHFASTPQAHCTLPAVLNGSFRK